MLFSTIASVSSAILMTQGTLAAVVTFGQTLTSNIQTIVNDLAGNVTAMETAPPFTDDMAPPIVKALGNFVFNQQALQSTILDRHSIFSQFGVTGLILVSLRDLEAAIDNRCAN
ncbi:hypothetical protein BYT27DRAFT_7206167 [Phlegmacium glaucopus]|nr:hypothetical protein BYT27DRAFT_7206167 [Phlegmacium glaucopus]